MTTPKTDNRGKVTISCVPPDISLVRSEITLKLGPVPFERGGLDKGKFKAGFLGILPSNGFTFETLKSIVAFFKPTDVKDNTVWETEFVSGLFRHLNNTYFRPAWAAVWEKHGKSGETLSPETVAKLTPEFQSALEDIINETRGEREKSSAQIQKLIDANNESLKAHREQFAALKTLFGVSTLKELSALGDKLDEKQKAFLATLQTIIDNGAKLKEEIAEAKAREEAARAKLSKDEQELSDLGLL